MAGLEPMRLCKAHLRDGERLVAALVILAVASSAAAQEALLERKAMTGEWNGVRPLLSEHGFEPYLVYSATVWSNLAGGRDTGVQPNGYLDFGFEVDLAKLGAWDGLGFHADFHWWQGGRPTDDLIGGLPAMALSDWEAAATLRVYNLYLRQAFDDDRFVLKVGQIAADTDFMVSETAGVFMNAAFGDLPSQSLNTDAPVYPLAAPGIFAAARPWRWLTGRFGAYTGDAGRDRAGNHGFEWRLGRDAGCTVFSELAAAPGGSLPGTYTLGGIYGTGASGQSRAGLRRTQDYELYLMVDQTILANDHGDPVLSAFGRLSGSPDDTPDVVGFYADAGLLLLGLLPSRPKDALGIAVSILRFTDDFEQEQRVAGKPVGGGETVLELTYQLAIAPWLVVQPDAQFFFEPAFSRRNAQAVGVQIVAIF